MPMAATGGSVALTTLVFAAENVAQHDRMIAIFVPGGIDQGHPSLAGQLPQLRQCGVSLQIRSIPLPEFKPFFRVMPIPPAQFSRWRNVLQPQVYPCRLLSHAARPEAIHQNAPAVRSRRRFVNPLDRYVHRIFRRRRGTCEHASFASSSQPSSRALISLAASGRQMMKSAEQSAHEAGNHCPDDNQDDDRRY